MLGQPIYHVSIMSSTPRHLPRQQSLTILSHQEATLMDPCFYHVTTTSRVTSTVLLTLLSQHFWENYHVNSIMDSVTSAFLWSSHQHVSELPTCHLRLNEPSPSITCNGVITNTHTWFCQPISILHLSCCCWRHCLRLFRSAMRWTFLEKPWMLPPPNSFTLSHYNGLMRRIMTSHHHWSKRLVFI